MQMGMVGLGRMGANLARRRRRAGHECVGFAPAPEAVAALAAAGGVLEQAEFQNRVLSAMRHAFGGHLEPREEK
jgi:6-phosphogluconate dehydrogenase (decarboxylating)